MSRGLPRGSEVNEIGPNSLEVLWMVITAVIFIALAVMGQSLWGSLQLRQPSLGWGVQG